MGNIEAVAKELFDTPGAIRPGYDLSVTAGAAVAAFAGSFESDVGFTTDGTYRGARVSIASHASVMGRQMGEFHHTYSHVVVDVLGMTKKFRLAREGVGAKLARATGIAKDAEIGEEAFDKTFTIDVDDAALAKSVLDESIQRRIMDLQSKVGLVSIDSGVGGMSILLTNQGLALRWPGDITPELARFIRDLLLDMRQRLLAYEDKKATRIATGEAALYRVASDAVEPSRALEEQEEEEVARKEQS
jgi:hypothetical protein